MTTRLATLPVKHPSATLLFVQILGILLYPLMGEESPERAVFGIIGLLVLGARPGSVTINCVVGKENGAVNQCCTRIFWFSARESSMDALFTSSGLIALVTLTFLEVVLGVDNIIFISILASKLPRSQHDLARRVGLLAAMGMRILLLLSIVWIIRLTAPLFSILGRSLSGRDLILIGGGLFLLTKATIEIHERLEGEEGHSSARVLPSFAAVITQIVLLDIVFSLDSVITAVGMVDEISVMITAVILP